VEGTLPRLGRRIVVGAGRRIGRGGGCGTDRRTGCDAGTRIARGDGNSPPISVLRIVGGIILMQIGFSLFMPSSATAFAANAPSCEEENVAFVPLAMPLMFGPGAIATVPGMASLVRHPLTQFPSLVAIIVAILATMIATYLSLAKLMPTQSWAASARAGSTRRRASSPSSWLPWAWD
jgi:hypothetical protein